MGFRELLKDLNAVRAEEKARKIVEARLRSFKKTGRGSSKDIFRELVFCILAANYTASGSMRIVEVLGDRLLELDSTSLERELRRLGHRHPHARAMYIVEARRKLDQIVNVIKDVEDEYELREWLVENVKGLGYKEASHFLRNIGYEGLAIIDFHILRLLQRYGLISEVKRSGKRRYLEIEDLLRRIAQEAGMTLAELDLYLWYMDSGKILK